MSHITCIHKLLFLSFLQVHPHIIH